MSRVQRASTVFVISDLHLGGGAPAMMGRPDLLASFIDGLPGRAGGVPASSVELVIAGDFVDFLAAAPEASFTAEPREACETLGSVTLLAAEPELAAQRLVEELAEAGGDAGEQG